MTEQELTALAKGLPEKPHINDFDTDDQLAWANDACALAKGYLALTVRLAAVEAERDQLKDTLHNIHMAGRLALSFGRQATPQTQERMIERRDEFLRGIVNVCEESESLMPPVLSHRLAVVEAERDQLREQRNALHSELSFRDLADSGGLPEHSAPPEALPACPQIDYELLDQGIRDVVAILRVNGFHTTDSGDGVSKPEDERVFETPHVACSVSRATMADEADRLARLMPDWYVEASYSPNDGEAILLLLPAPSSREARTP